MVGMMVVVKVMLVSNSSWCGSDSCGSGHGGFGINGGDLGHGEFINFIWILVWLIYC